MERSASQPQMPAADPAPTDPAPDDSPAGPQADSSAAGGPTGRLGQVSALAGRLRGNPWVKIITVVAASRIALTLVASQAVASFVGSPDHTASCWVARHQFTDSSLLRLWGNWDTGWYLGLAQNGYPKPPASLKGWAFQPLYPLLMHLLGDVLGGRNYLAGVIISAVCLVVACYFVYRLALLDHDEATAWRATWFFLLLPTSFTFSAVLTEALFTVLAITAFYYGRTGRWALACGLVSLCAVTRTVGLLVAVALALEYLAQRGWSWRRPWLVRLRLNVATFAIAPLGLVVFALYGRQLTGDALVFQHVQYTQWHHEKANLWTVLTASLRVSLAHPANLRSMVILLTTGWLVVTVIAALARWIRPSYLIYTLAIILPPLTLGSGAWQSMYRYLAPAFPMAFILARASRNRTVETSLVIALALFQGMLMTVWTTCFTATIL